MSRLVSWFFKQPAKERLGLVCLGLFILLFLPSATYCGLKKPTTIVGFEPLRARLAMACDDAGSCRTKVILLQGQIIETSASVMNDVNLLIRPDINLICFDSPGGNNDVARKLGDDILAKKLSTCMAKKYVTTSGELISDSAICNSACPWVLLAGANRILFSQMAAVGFHASLGRCRICGITLFTFEVPGEKDSYAKQILSRDLQLNIGPDKAKTHLELLEKSFSFGTGAARYISADDLFHRYAFFTEIKFK